MFRGEPRFTADVDVVALIDVERALTLIDQLDESPFRPLFPGVEEVLRKAFMLPLHHRETNITVDLALGLTGFEQAVVTRATPVSVKDCELPIATAEDLLLLKLIAGRPRDTDDAFRIVVKQADALDWSYLEETGADLQKSLARDFVPQLMRWRRELA
jgi:hypothetical protein